MSAAGDAPAVLQAPPGTLERRHWLAALAMLFVLFAPYQTLVQTVITDDAVRKGIEADDYDMIWVQGGGRSGKHDRLTVRRWLRQDDGNGAWPDHALQAV